MRKGFTKIGGYNEMNPAFYHTYHLRVRYSETDQMKIVYHTNYLTWLELGRTEYIREIAGISYKGVEEKGVLLPVTNATLSFHSPARYDDEIEIRTSIEYLTPIRMNLGYEIYRVNDNKLLVTGKTEHVFTNPQIKPIRLPKVIPELYSCLQSEYEKCLT